MDDLRHLLAQQQRELECLQRQCEGRAASARKSPSSPHLVQLRKLHNTLARQRRHLEALEVLRTLESLEWREAENQRELAEQKKEAELEAMLQRHCRERQLLEQHLLRAHHASGAVDLASSWEQPPLRPLPPHHRCRRLRPGAPARLTPALPECSVEHRQAHVSGSCYDWEAWQEVAAGGGGHEQNGTSRPCSPCSPSAACRAYDSTRRWEAGTGPDAQQPPDCQQSWAYQEAAPECEARWAASSQHGGHRAERLLGSGDVYCEAWRRPTAADRLHSEPVASEPYAAAPPVHPLCQSRFSLGPELSSAVAADCTQAPACERPGLAAAPAPEPASAFDSTDWDVFRTLQHAAEQWYQELPSSPRSPACLTRSRPGPQSGTQQPQPAPLARAQARQSESPLAQRLAHLRGFSAGPALGGAGQLCPVTRRAGSAPVSTAVRAACNSGASSGGSMPLPSIHHQPQRPWSSGTSCVAGGRQGARYLEAPKAAASQGCLTAPLASSPCLMSPATAAWGTRLSFPSHRLDPSLLPPSRATARALQHYGQGDWSSTWGGVVGAWQQGPELNMGSVFPVGAQQLEHEIKCVQEQQQSMQLREMPRGRGCLRVLSAAQQQEHRQETAAPVVTVGLHEGAAATPAPPWQPALVDVAWRMAAESATLADDGSVYQTPGGSGQCKEEDAIVGFSSTAPKAACVEGDSQASQAAYQASLKEQPVALPAAAGAATELGRDAKAPRLETALPAGQGEGPGFGCRAVALPCPEVTACQPNNIITHEIGTTPPEVHAGSQPGQQPQLQLAVESSSAGAAQAAVALHDYCRHGRYDEARQLLKDSTLAIDVRDPQGNTALMLGCAGGHGRIVKLCLRKGAAINAQNVAGDTALLLAAAAGHNAVAKHLLECGADPAVKNNSGESAGELINKWAAQTGQ